MPDSYDSHGHYMQWVRSDADQRQSAMEESLRAAFRLFIETREVEVVVFSSMSIAVLSEAIAAHPAILKPLIACCNIAGRAIERDLDIKGLDTYIPKISADQAKAISAYVKPFLPDYVELPTLARVDRILFIDKEIRKRKGRWEKQVVEAINRLSRVSFRKRRFSVEGEAFELDAAAPMTGPIEFGVDVKRIEARRDIHKRCDEIINKAAKFRDLYPRGKFAAVIYYPFVEEHSNVQSRLRSPDIACLVFAGSSPESVESSAKMLLATLEVPQK